MPNSRQRLSKNHFLNCGIYLSYKKSGHIPRRAAAVETISQGYTKAYRPVDILCLLPSFAVHFDAFLFRRCVSRSFHLVPRIVLSQAVKDYE